MLIDLPFYSSIDRFEDLNEVSFDVCGVYLLSWCHEPEQA